MCQPFYVNGIWSDLHIISQGEEACNLGQKVADKLTKQNSFFYGMFTADFLPKSVEICFLVGLLGIRHRIQAFQKFSGNFLIS